MGEREEKRVRVRETGRKGGGGEVSDVSNFALKMETRKRGRERGCEGERERVLLFRVVLGLLTVSSPKLDRRN